MMVFLMTAPGLCRAQWLTQRIALVPGWNAVYLDGQPEPSGCAEVFNNLPVQSVWKWDRQFSTIQFTVDPATLLPGGITNALAGTVTVHFDDPVNPFLHRYHPMHDNQNWDWQAYTNAVETPTIVRDLAFTFITTTNAAANPYNGADRVSGVYQETLSGLRAQPIVMQGVFSLQRISHINTLKGTTP